MSNRVAAMWLALTLIVGALIAGFVPVHTEGVACGSAFNGGDDDTIAAQFGADLDDIYAGRPAGTTADFKAACDDRRSTQRAFVIPLLIVGALGGGFLLLTARRSDSEGQSPTAV